MPADITQNMFPKLESTLELKESGLSDICIAMLMQWNMCAAPSNDGISSDVYTKDGKYRFTVRQSIHQLDLHALLVYGERMMEIGRHLGEDQTSKISEID